MVHLRLTFEEIMKPNILFYDQAEEAACFDITNHLKIDNLPAISGKDFYELQENHFKRKKINTGNSVRINNCIFDTPLIKKFHEYEIVNGEKAKADPEEFKDKKYKKNIFNELDYLDTSLWKLELIGEEKVNDEDCYKVKASLVNGEVRNLFFSKGTFYMLREDKLSNAEKGAFSSTFFSDYRKFGKLTYYSVMKFSDGEKTQIGKIVKLLPNQDISEKDFD